MSKRTLCLPNTSLAYFLLSICFLQIALLLPLLLHGILRSFTESLPKLFRITYWFTCFVFFIAGISIPVHFLFNMEFSGYCDNFKRIEITVSILTESYLLSLILMYCLYYLRLYLSFKHSPFALSKCMQIFLMFGALLQCILVLLFRVIYLQFWDDALQSIKDRDRVKELRNALGISLYFQIFNVLNFFYNILLFFLFISKLRKLKHHMMQYQKEHDRLQQLTKPVIIYTICLSLSFISGLIQTFMGWNTASNDSNELHMIHLAYMSYDVLINALSVNLQFKHAEKTFGKIFGCCYRTNEEAENTINTSHANEEAVHSHETTTRRNSTSTDNTVASAVPQLKIEITDFGISRSGTNCHIPIQQ